MSHKDIDDYLQEGIYGTKELKPEERKLFLGTYRERVIIALTKGQVMKKQGLEQLRQLMSEYQNGKILLNGSISSRFFTPFKKLATANKIRYTTIYNQEANTHLGLVFTSDQAIDKEDIYLPEPKNEKKEEVKDNKTSLFDRIKNWWQK